MALDSLEGVDAIIYMVDAKRKPYAEEEQITAMLSKQQTPVVMVINKIDRSERCVGDYIALWQKQIAANKAEGIMRDPLQYFIKISALKDIHLDEVKKAVASLMPQGEPMYHFKLTTDFPLRFRICDAIREKVCHLFSEEVPHHTAVRIEAVERMKGKGGVWVLSAEVLLASDSQKHIVVGKGGSMIKEIGIRSRKEIEKMLGTQIHLDLKVRVEEDWFNKPRIINELGYGAV
jgi:GTP-binding protein Era